MRRRRTVAASVVAVLALAAGTTAVAAPGGPLGLFEDRDDRRAEQAQALGEKLGVAPARVERAFDEVHRERREERQDEMAKALAERLNVPQADAERALDRAFAARRDRREGPPEPGARGERGERGARGGAMAQAIASELDKNPEEVRRALIEIRRERFEVRLAEGVEEGRITEEQATEIREQAEWGRGRGLGPPHGGPGHGPGGDGPSGGGSEGIGDSGGSDGPLGGGL